MLDLDPIKSRLNAATPGPWKQRDGWKQTVVTTGRAFRCPPDCPSEHLIPYQDSDGDFIAHAPTDIAALIAEVERVRAENAELKEKEKRLIDVAMSEVNFWSKADIEAIDPQEALDYWVEVLKEAQS